MEKVKCPKCEEYNSPNSKYCSYCGFEISKTETEAKNIVEHTNPKTNIDKKKIIGIVVGVITFFFIFYFTQQLFSPSFDKQMVKMTSEWNKNCPMMVDQYTRWDNSLALPNKILQYNYTLIDIERSEVNLDTVRKYIEPGIINNIRTNPDLKSFRDNNITFQYNYRDKNGEFVWMLKVTPDKYEND